MRLANYGMIALNGKVRRPEPGANFFQYQSGLASYQLSLSLKKQVNKDARALDRRLSELAASIKKTLAA